MKKLLVIVCSICAGVACAEHVVDISGAGAQKFAVEVRVAHPMFAKCLKRNLENSGLFLVRDAGSIRVTGTPGAIRAEGRGKTVAANEAFADDKAARMAARRLSDAMCEAFGNQKGFACDKLIFLKRGQRKGAGGAIPGEVCMAYPDGFDIRQLTSDGRVAIFPRWKDADSVFYIGYLKGAPQIWDLNTLTGQRKMKWSFKGSPTGIAVSPDGNRVAAILSVHGNPELYVISGERWSRLTNTPLASEGQPAWSPDGRQIAYVSDETRHPQIYVVDVATKVSRRLTSKGRENVDPDWGPDGKLAYITKRGGSQIAVLNVAEGDRSSRTVTDPGNWEHPSWSRDGRHVAANRDRALFIVDTLENGDAPRQMFHADGNFISPSWRK